MSRESIASIITKVMGGIIIALGSIVAVSSMPFNTHESSRERVNTSTSASASGSNTSKTVKGSNGYEVIVTSTNDPSSVAGSNSSVPNSSNADNETQYIGNFKIGINSNKDLKNAYPVSLVNKWLKGEEKPKEKIVFLTFDDGPSHNNTPKILDILKKNNVNGTFFYLTGNSLKNVESVVKRTVAEGNVIGIHTHSHNYQYLYPKRWANVNNILADYKKAYEEIRSILPGYTTGVSRFPGGSMSWNGMTKGRQAIKELGLENIDWNTMSGDADVSLKNKSVQGVLNLMHSMNASQPDQKVFVVLMHDSSGNKLTVPSLQSIINYYKKRGFKFGVLY